MKYKTLLAIIFSMSFTFVNGQNKIEKQITNDTYEDYDLSVSGNKMVWYQDSLQYTNLMYWDGYKTIKLVDQQDLKADKSPAKISGNYITWSQKIGGNYEIMLFDGQMIKQITNNDYDDIRPDLYQDKIVWQSYHAATDKNDVHYYDGATTIKLNSDTLEAYYPRISKNKIAFKAEGANGRGIFIYENGQAKLISNFSSDFSTGVKDEPQVSDNNVIWSGQTDAGKWSIYYYDNTTHQINDSYNYTSVKDVYNNSILFNGEGADKSYNVFLYDGSINQITNDGASSPETMYGDTVLFERSGKIYIYTKTNGSTEITHNGNDDNAVYKGGVLAWIREINNSNEIFIFADNDADVTAPVVSEVTVDGITGISATAHLTSNEAGTVYVALQLATAIAPNANAIKAETGFVFAGTIQAMAATPVEKSITGLTSETNYTLYIIADDSNGNISEVSSVSFKTPDITAPILSTISVDHLTITGATAQLTSNEAGTAYFAVQLSSSAAPSPTAIKEGTNFIASGNRSITTTLTSINITGLSAITPYSFYTLVVDAANNTSDVGKVNFTTLITSTGKTTGEELLTLYPNPANGSIKITTRESAQYKIISILGTIVSSGQLDMGQSTIDISNLKKGNYFIQTTLGETTVTKKLIVE